MSETTQDIKSEYSETTFWEKLTTFAKAAGSEVIEKALWLHFAAKSPETPAWASGIMYGSLGYFILPLDAIPDITPIIGFTDDLGVMAAALTTVAVHITDEVKEASRQKMQTWFGD